METTPSASEVVRMSSLGSTVMLRDSIDSLFDQLEAGHGRRVIFDFTEVEFMSRSSAHEYLIRKSRSRLSVSETGMGPEVAQMLDLVQRQIDRSRNGVPRGAPPWSTTSPQSI